MFFKMREYKFQNNILYIKCNKCGIFKKKEDFHINKRYKRWINCSCKECRKLIVKSSTRKNHERVNEYRKKQIKKLNKFYGFNRHRFHMKAYRYVLKNGLKPSICPICKQKNKIQIHHPFYESFEDWSKIILCCSQCHSDIHHHKISCPKPINLLLINKND